MAAMTRAGVRAWLIATACGSVACGDSKPSEATPEPVAAAGPSETTGTTGLVEPEVAASSTSSTTTGAALAPPVDVLGPWTVLFAYDVDAAAVRELSTALSGAGLLAEHEPLLVSIAADEAVTDDSTWLVAGLHADEDAAKDAARKLGKKLERKAVAWQLRSGCQRVDGGLSCGSFGRYEPLELWPLELRSEVPEPAGAVPPAITHAPAGTVLVVGSNLAFEPGKTSIDTSPKFRTWIWQPARGALPKKGNVSGPAPAEGADPSTAPIVEEREGAWLAAGGRLHRLVSEDEAQPIPRCDCDATIAAAVEEEEDEGNYEGSYEGGADERPVNDDRFAAGSGTVVEKSSSVDLKFPNLYDEVDGERKLLLPFSSPSRAQCANSRTDMRVDFQIVALAGDLVFVAHRERLELCEGIIGELAMELLVLDLANGGDELELGTLEAELDPAAVGKAREKAAHAISKLFETTEYLGEREALWPEALALTAMFPRYREWKGGMEMIVQYGIECTTCYEDAESVDIRTLDAIDWDSQFWVAREAIKYPASSRLAPPPDALALFEYVHRVHGNWKTLGWSVVPSDAAPAPSPTPSEPPVQPPPSP